MAILDLFSKRQKRLRGEAPDVYQYDQIPQPLRVQIAHILFETLGDPSQYHDRYHTYGTSTAYATIVHGLCREYGVFRLWGDTRGDRDYLTELVNFLLKEEDTDRVIDVIQMSFRMMDNATRQYGYLERRNADEVADAAISELNARFKEHGVGFEYMAGDVVRIDSELIHQEVVKPALRVLSQKRFAGAQAEFLRAHEHYRKENQKESLNEALKALESVLKVICDRRGWRYPATATSKTLLDLCFANGLVPDFWQSALGALRSLLESGVPTGRNRISGHGQGAQQVDVPNHIVSFVLHMTASSIVFLAQADEARK